MKAPRSVQYSAARDTGSTLGLASRRFAGVIRLNEGLARELVREPSGVENGVCLSSCRRIGLLRKPTAGLTSAGMRHTSRRRSAPDPLAPISEPTWLVAREFREALEVIPLAPQADLRAALVAAHEARKAAGWAVEQISSRSASFFCSMGGRRLMVGIERRDPSQPPSNHGSPPSHP